MRTLRVLLPAAPAADRADAWALVDERGGAIATGRSPPAQWPAADRREAILAAPAVRVLACDLPPLPADRVAQAVKYALEERLAAPLAAAVVIAGPQSQDGRIVATVVERTQARALAAHVPAFARIVAEPQIGARPAAGTWRWCASAGHGFVLTDDGEAFAVASGENAALPAELKVAVEQAARRGRAPARIEAYVPADDATRQAWTLAAGVPFLAGPVWNWAGNDVAGAPDLASAFARESASRDAAPAPRASFARALGILAVAAALHVLATVGTWGWRTFELARSERTLADLVRAAGASDAADLARRHAAASHRAGRNVPQDAWPRFAQAAPALAALPAGTLRSARYAAGAWTVELGAVDDAALAALDARLRSAGLTGIAARSPTGIRMRIEGAA